MNPGRTSIASATAFLALGALAAAQATGRVSVDSTGAQGDDFSQISCLSFDGRFVLFESDATNLVSGDTNGLTDIFVHDRLTGTTERVNVDSSGNEAVDDRCAIDNITCISADGRFVSFYGWASNLAPGVDTNGSSGSNVFFHDRLTGITEAIDVTPAGVCTSESSGGSMSSDGRFVAFTSAGLDLLAGGTNGMWHVWVHDRATGLNEIASVDSSGNEGNDRSSDGQYISADGRFVCFGSFATNLVPGITHGEHVYVHDRQTGVTELVDMDPNGLPGNDAGIAGPMSSDGRYVTFWSESSNLGEHGTNGSWHVFLRDRATGIVELMSVDSNGIQGDAGGEFPSITADGRFVAFGSFSTNLVPNDTNSKEDLFVHDRLTGMTTRWNVRPDGSQSDWTGLYFAASFPGFSGDGRFLSFTAWSDDLVGGDTNGVRDVFVRGPYLTLEADPPQVAAGATLTFTTWTGDASNLAMLALIDVDGAPIFLPAAISSFDAGGVWPFSATVPSGLTGSVWTFRSYGFVPTGKVQASNDVAVTFQ
jgi:Tol biopolymer transport system component